MDWCLMKLDFDLNNNPKLIPCHLLCFFTVHSLKQPYSSIGGYPIDTNGMYAVARRFQDVPKKTASEFVQRGRLINSLDIESDLMAKFFENKNAATPPSYECLYNACTLQDDIQLEPFEMALNDNESSDSLSSSESESSDSSSD
eukprot:jgi/Psemu1/312498/fgenesh1_kg.965_\